MTLNRCFELFTAQEQLSKEDTWYCSRCKDHVQAFKRMEVCVTPQVLVLQLKRFTYRGVLRNKNSVRVEFPMEGLDLSKYIGQLGGGHYVAYARSSSDGAWYLFDDPCVRS